MTEIIAAHLERVAKELAERLVTEAFVYLCDGEIFSVHKATEILAAALAACAREARAKAIEDVMEIVDGSQSTDKRVEWVIRKIGQAIRERAVGEKA